MKSATYEGRGKFVDVEGYVGRMIFELPLCDMVLSNFPSDGWREGHRCEKAKSVGPDTLPAFNIAFHKVIPGEKNTMEKTR